MAQPVSNPTVEYRSVSPDPRSFRFYLRLYALYVFGCGGAPLALMLLVVPRFRATFASFKTALPTVSVAVLQLSQLLSTGLWIVALAAMLALPFALAAMTVSVQSPESRRRLTRWTTGIALLGSVLAIVTVLLALLLPLLKLIAAVK